MAREKLFDCCWVELDGVRHAQLVIQIKRRPALFAVGEYIYNELGQALPTQPDAPAIKVIHATTLSPKRKSA